MPALNFKAQFAIKVCTGAKLHTIRAPRKRPIKPGDTLYLYYGMRTKHCRFLMSAPCKQVQRIRFHRRGIVPVLTVDKRDLDGQEFETLAKADGFESLGDFLVFFQEQFDQDVTWDLIHWDWIA